MISLLYFIKANKLEESGIKIYGEEVTTIDACKKFVEYSLSFNMRRKQIKDRVYLIEGKEEKGNAKISFILKEKKTRKHKDIPSDNRDGLSSLEEIKIADKLNKNSNRTNGHFCVNFEKPIMAVEFPDEYQFAIFQHNKYIENGVDRLRPITVYRSILGNREHFELEYLDLKEKTDMEISFERYATIKSVSIQDHLYAMYHKILAEECLQNTDVDRPVFNIAKGPHGKLFYIMNMFDFEYFVRIEEEEAKYNLVNDKEWLQEDDMGDPYYELGQFIHTMGVEELSDNDKKAFDYFRQKMIEVLS